MGEKLASNSSSVRQMGSARPYSSEGTASGTQDALLQVRAPQHSKGLTTAKNTVTHLRHFQNACMAEIKVTWAHSPVGGFCGPPGHAGRKSMLPDVPSSECSNPRKHPWLLVCSERRY